MSSAPTIPATTDAATAAAAPNVGAGSIADLFSALERVTDQKNAVSTTEEARFAPAGPATPRASRSPAPQDNASEGDDDSLATRVNSSGFVDAVIPRRRGNEKKVVLTRKLLESYHHESLDAVTERLGLSKTTIKAACRRLGLPKWPYQHTGPRKRKMGVPIQHAGESAHERTLKDTFHELMGKRQRVGEVQMAPSAMLTSPLTSLPGTTMVDIQAHMQSLSALSAMAATLNASGQHFALNAPSAFPAPPLPGPQQLLLGGAFGGNGNYGGNINYGGNYGGAYMPEAVGGFQPWGGPPRFSMH
ncbi:hypothetical protein T484DRAFT_1749339 [Baffinella frigidus]|nr:hypothetical protein T484DRAFT_1749339 [Cryptophyta sp. CCMP2293]